MARILKEDEYQAKRDEILDAALRLVYTKGYQQMTIQDILDDLGISKGAFYHYFPSKEALLEGLVERMGHAAEAVLLPIVQDPNLTAIQKFNRYFKGSAQWKSGQKELIRSLLSIWYGDENAFLRQKIYTLSLAHTSRLLEPMIAQGIEEKVFTTCYPAQAAVIITGVFLNLTDSISGFLLHPHLDQAVYRESSATLEAYVDAIERILGAPQGSLQVFEAEDFKEWFEAV
jgi:TetR/AcrR family transcriptional regulator, transcriptional repressor for nem operon